MRQSEIPLARDGLTQSPAGLIHVFCGSAAIGWLLLLAVTFTEWAIVILAATIVWLIVAGLTLLLMISLSRKRLTWKRIATIAACWILGTLLISNFAVATWQTRQRLWSGFVFDSRYGWYPEVNLRSRQLEIPNGSYLVSTDELGHRNPLPYPEDRFLPAILQGDSNAFGFGLAEDQTLSAMLNSDLPNLALYNMGVPGFDLNHYFFQYAELAKEFRIGRRIVFWNIGNDFTLSALETPNFFRRPYLYVKDGTVHQAANFHSSVPVQGYGQSFIPPYDSDDGLVRMVAHDWADLYPEPLIRLPLTRQLIRTYHPKLCRLGQLLSRQPKPLELLDPDWMLLKQELWPAPFSEYAKDLPLLLRELKQQNPQLTICVFPFREQIIDAEAQLKFSTLKAAGYTKDDQEPFAFNQYFKRICDAEAIQLVDPTAEFLQDHEPLSLYQFNDQHLSAKGMHLCAKALAKVLKEDAAVPRN